MKIKVAIVIPWFGKDLKGGAEQHAWQIAKRLSNKNIEVTALTTCSKEFVDNWDKNFYKAGKYCEDGIDILRFPVKKRNKYKFDTIVTGLLSLKTEELIPGVSPLNKNKENIFKNENINSPELIQCLEKNYSKFNVFLFIPYLYGPILKGIEKVKQKAILIPCLHDESYAYLDCVACNFFSAKKIFFLSEGEYETAKKIYGPAIIPKSKVLGAGVELDIEYIDNYSKPIIVNGDYILSLGRRDVGKNTDLIIKSFDNFIEQTNSNLKLVIAGPGNLPIKPKSDKIIDLGLVSDDDKINLLKYCKALVNPSINESFSRVIFEAWLVKKPVIIHKDCLATYKALENSKYAGWCANTVETFVNVFLQLVRNSNDLIEQMAINGYEYAKNIAIWDKIIDRYIKEIDDIIKKDNCVISKKTKSIHQLLPTFAYGDAISNHAIFIRNFFISNGYNSIIFAQSIDHNVADKCEVFVPNKLKSCDSLIYHHSIGFGYTPYAIKHKGEKLLIYHNITPAFFYAPYDKEIANNLENGRKEMQDLANEFVNSVGDSQYNADELENYGFRNPSVLPLIVDPGKWNFFPDKDIMRKFNDTKKNLLYVGRLAPNKCQDDLIKMYYYLRQMNSDTRLILVGGGSEISSYVQKIFGLVKQLDLEKHVIVTGHVSEKELQAYYRCADMFISMSEHEGFGVPLIEAMWFDVPVVAYKSSAIPETLGDAALMFTDKSNLIEVAAFVNIILNDELLLARILKSQALHREKYTSKKLSKVYDEKLWGIFDGQ